jgi:hypothetical protein
MLTHDADGWREKVRLVTKNYPVVKLAEASPAPVESTVPPSFFGSANTAMASVTCFLSRKPTIGFLPQTALA